MPPKSDAFRPAQGDSDKSIEVAQRPSAGIPLVQQLTAKDWRDAGQKPDVLKHEELTITDIARDKSILTDSSANEQDKAKAALELYRSGIKEFTYTDKDGTEHVLKLDFESKNGVNTLKMNDGNGFETSFEYVQDEHGQWHFVPRQTGGGGTNSSHSDAAPARSTGGTRGGGSSSGGGGGGGGGGDRVPSSRPSGLSYSGSDANGVGRYSQPGGSSAYNPAGAYDHHVWQGVRNTDGSVAIRFNGCQVDTDGAGAHRHPEDATRQSQTSLRLSNGQSLDTDRDNFFVLPPSVARAYGIKKGDLGWLVQEKTGKAVPVVFGDAGPEGKLGEASVHALKSLGYNVNGRMGVDKSEQFKVVFVPGSGDGTGDIASDPKAMAAKLAATGKTGGATQVA